MRWGRSPSRRAGSHGVATQPSFQTRSDPGLQWLACRTCHRTLPRRQRRPHHASVPASTTSWPATP